MGHQAKKNVGATRHANGVEFRVWAPFAKNVKLMLPYLDVFDGSNLHDMSSEQDGYWSVHVKNAEPGQSYKFQIDTGKELIEKNDPRGRSITANENGVSVLAAGFDWGKDGFEPLPREQQVIYELHIGTFNRQDSATQGTFYDAIEKLDYLKELGITTVELMPVTSMVYGNGWGYNVTDLYSIETTYGGRHGLMEFVKACHERQIGVIIDVVYNHLLSTNLWRFDGWYENNHGGIYFYNDERGDTPWGHRPDYGRAEVRQFLSDNVVMWFNEFHVDGLRLDSTIYMRNTLGKNGDPAHDIADAWTLLQDMNDVAHTIKPGATMIAEDSSGNNEVTKAISDNGAGFDAQWELTFPHAVRQMLGIAVPYSTDLPQLLSSAYNGDPFQRIVFSDSHDTAANGATRITEAVVPKNPGSLLTRQRLLIADAITLTSPGIPMLLQGQEFLQEGNFNDWQELEWANVAKYNGIVTAHKHLIALRRNAYGNTAGLVGKSIAVIHNDTARNILAYHRWNNGGPKDDVLIIVNFNGTEQSDYRMTFPHAGEWRVRFNSSWKGYSADFSECTIESITASDDGSVTFSIPPYCVYILSQD